MVRRVIKMMYREVRGLHQAAYLLALFTFGSQLLALVRDRLLAHVFGASTELDIYYTAFRIPDLLYVLFASMLSVYVLIPFVSRRMKEGGAPAAQQLLSDVATLFLVAYTLLAAAVFVAAPLLVPYVAPGLVDHTGEVVLLMRILLLQPLLLGLSSLLGVVTQLQHRFVIYAISPLLYNIGIIIGIAYLYPLFGIAGLAYGVVIGAAAHLMVQVPLVYHSELRIGVSTRPSGRALWSVLQVSVPRALTLALHQGALLLLIAIASTMEQGSVSVFQFAFNLQSVPLAVIGASYSIAAFPLLADLFATEQMNLFRKHVLSAVRHLIFWSVPIVGLVIVLRAQMVRVVLGSGSFNWSDTRLTAAVLAVLAVSLLAQAINLLIVRTFYAAGNTRVPFWVTSIGMSMMVLSTYGLYHLYTADPTLFTPLYTWLRIDAVAGAEVVLIALGYSTGMIVQTSIMFAIATRLYQLPARTAALPLLRAVFAALVGGFAAYSALNFFVFGLNPESFIGVFLHGFIGAVIGIGGVIIAYYLTRAPELTEIMSTFTGKMKAREMVTVQDDVL